jgi:hypothetical protein
VLHEVYPARFPIPDHVVARLCTLIEQHVPSFDRAAVSDLFSQRDTLYVIPLDVAREDAARVRAALDPALREAGLPAQTGVSVRAGQWNGIYVAYENF